MYKKQTTKYNFYFGFSKQFQGLGLTVDFDLPQCGHPEKVFSVQIIFLYYRAWMVKYKTPV